MYFCQRVEGIEFKEVGFNEELFNVEGDILIYGWGEENIRLFFRNYYYGFELMFCAFLGF